MCLQSSHTTTLTLCSEHPRRLFLSSQTLSLSSDLKWPIVFLLRTVSCPIAEILRKTHHVVILSAFVSGQWRRCLILILVATVTRPTFFLSVCRDRLLWLSVAQALVSEQITFVLKHIFIAKEVCLLLLLKMC